MWVLGVTGGIGSGKTAATDYLASKGITIVDADECSRIVVEPGRPALTAIEEHFGSEAIQVDGTLDRAWLRTQVFSNPDERKWLEQLTHPLIRDEIVNQLNAATSAYAVLASPLLFETGQSAFCNRTLVIDVSIDTQLARASARDANSVDQIKKIIAAQMPREERLEKADDVASNEGSLEELYAQLDKLHESYIKLLR